MALSKCKECGKEVSSKAEACPHCGAPIKKQQKQYGCGTLILLGIIVMVLISVFSSNDTSTSSVPKTPEEIRKAEIEKHFSAWDGSHRGLTEVIKKSMNDPNSYEHEKTVFWDKGDHLIVKTTFRGKNAFGGVVKNWVMAKVDLNGNVVEIISQGP
ncbi:MAG: zinc-ribbon domain-containing protein [Methylotenera sp.]